MASFTPTILSGSTNGRMILVTATATLGTAIHTATAGTTNHDNIYLWAINAHTGTVRLSVEFGGVTSPGDLIVVDVPANSGLYTICPGMRLRNGLAVTAFAATGSVISIGGNVDRWMA